MEALPTSTTQSLIYLSGRSRIPFGLPDVCSHCLKSCKAIITSREKAFSKPVQCKWHRDCSTEHHSQAMAEELSRERRVGNYWKKKRRMGNYRKREREGEIHWRKKRRMGNYRRLGQLHSWPQR